MAHYTLTVNGRHRVVEVAADTPLLYVLRNDLGLNGPQFGCGLGQCGACAVLADGRQIRSCLTTVAAAEQHSITTLEGLPALWRQRHRSAPASALHPVQQAWVDEQVPQCGMCQNGMIIQAVDLLSHTSQPTDAQIRNAMDGHLCRCGTYLRIVRAIKRAARAIAGSSEGAAHA